MMKTPQNPLLKNLKNTSAPKIGAMPVGDASPAAAPTPVFNAAPKTAVRGRGLKGLHKKPVQKKKGGAGKIVFLLLAVVGAGAIYYYQTNKPKAARPAEIVTTEVKKDDSAARLAAEKAEKERLARLAAEKAEQERLARLAAEEEARRKALADTTVEPAPEPAVVPDIDTTDEVVPEALKGVVALTGVDVNKSSNVAAWKKAMEVAFAEKAWEHYHAFLIRTLQGEFKKLTSWSGFDLAKFKENPKMLEAMNLNRFLNLVSPGWLEEKSETPFLKYLVSDENKSLQALLSCLTGIETTSEMERVLDTWERIWKESSEEFRKKYQSLAIATAIMRPDAPGPCKLMTADESSSSYNEASKPMEIDAVYRNLVAYSEQGRLRGRIDLMTPTQLTYVVNIALPPSEMAWVQKEPKLRPLKWDTWGSAYGLVRYRMDRAAKGVNPYTDYSFEDILEQGGICMDQAYFAVNTARCAGIPAAYVTGSGKLGGHAWMIYLNSKDDWVEAGGVGYTSGTTRSPQTGEVMHQSLFTMEGDRRSGGKRLLEARLILSIADTLVSLEQYDVAKDLFLRARKAAPTHPLPWRASIKFLGREEAATKFEEWEEMVKDIRRRFKDRPDFLTLAEEIENEYIFPNQDAKENAKQLARQRNKLERSTDDGRVDLITKALQREADNLVRSEKFDAVDKLYKNALREYSAQNDAYPAVMRQYFDFALQHKAYQQKAVEAMWNTFRTRVETKDQGFFVAKTEVGIGDTIAGYFREIGDDKKADSIIKHGEDRLERIKRKIKEEREKPTRKKKPTRAERLKGEGGGSVSPPEETESSDSESDS